MFSQIKKLLGQSAVYGIGLMGTSIAMMVLQPIFLRRLNPAEYGMNELLNTFSSMLLSIIALGIASVLVKIYINDCETDQQRKTLVSSMVAFTSVLGLLVWLASYASSSWLSDVLLKEKGHEVLVQLAAAGSGLLLVQQMALLCLRARQRALSFATVSLVQLSVLILCNAYFLCYRSMGVLGIQVAAIVAAVASVFIGLYMIRADLTLKLSWRVVKQVLMLSCPLIPASVVPWILSYSNRYYLNAYWGLAETGLYAVGFKIGMLGIVILVQAFQLAWTSLYFANRDNDDAPQFCAHVFKYYMMVLVASGLTLSVFAPEILRVISEKEYWGAGWTVPFVAISYVFYGMQFFTVPLFVGANRNKTLGLLMVGIGVLNTVLNLILIPRFGASGAIAATMGTFAVWAGVSMYLGNSFRPVPYQTWDILKLLVSAAVLYIVFSFGGDASRAHSLMKLACIPSLLVLLSVTRFFGSREVSIVRSIPSRVIRKIRPRQGKAA